MVGLPAPPWPARRNVLGLAFGVAIAAAIAFLAVTHGSGRSSFAPLAVPLFLALPTWMFFSRRVELSLAILLVYLGLADGVIKLETGSQLATLGRDVLFYAIAIGMLVRRIAHGRSAIRWPALSGWVIAWFAAVLVQLLNPGNGSWAHSFASLRQDLEFVPLFFVGATVIDSPRRLRALLVLMLVVAAVNGAVALIQAQLTPDQLAGWGPGYADLIHGTHGAPRLAVGPDGKPRVRPPGLGGDMGFAGILGAIALPGGLALLIASRRSGAFKLTIGGLMVLAALGPIASQSRSAVIVTVVALLVFSALVGASKRGKQVLAGLLLMGVLGGVAVTLVSSSSSSDPFYRYRSIAPSNVVGTTVESRSGTFADFGAYLGAYPFGAGIGSSGPATGFFGSSKHVVNGESQFTFLVAEVGIPGLLVFLAFQAHLIVGAIRRLRRLVDAETQILLAALVAPLCAFVVNWVVGINTTSTPNAPFLWLAAGVLSSWLFSRSVPSRSSGGRAS